MIMLPGSIYYFFTTLAVILVCGVIALKKFAFVNDKEQAFLLIVAIAYTSILFIFNLQGYLSSAAKFGYQGRYLLPVIPILFAHITYITLGYVKSEEEQYL